jgi:hypothetical protein
MLYWKKNRQGNLELRAIDDPQVLAQLLPYKDGLYYALTADRLVHKCRPLDELKTFAENIAVQYQKET